MNQYLTAIFALLFTICSFSQVSPADGKTFYVSPTGSDKNSGSADQPMASLAEAARRVRDWRQSPEFLAKPESTVVCLKAGRWFLSQPLVLTAADSGTEQAPIVWQAESVDNPQAGATILSGGIKISDWSVVPQNGKSQTTNAELWSAPIPEPLLNEPNRGTQLFVDNVRAVRARTPNVTPERDSDQEYFRAKRIYVNADSGPGTAIGLKAKTGLVDSLILDANGQPNPNADLVLFQCWSSCHNRIAQYNSQTGRIDFTRPLGRFYLGSENRFYIENTRACLDQPGEWFLDRSEGRIFYIPRPGEKLEKADVIVSFVPQTLIRLDGDRNAESGKTIDYVNFAGLTFSHSDADLSPTYEHSVQGCDTQRGAFDATGWRFSELTDCTFAHVGENGVNLMAGCRNNRVARNRLFDLGAGGIYLPDKPKPPVPDGSITAYNCIDNNLIFDGGRIYHAACGVFLAGIASYNQITHNDIADFTWTAIHLGWSWSSSAKTWTHHNEVGFNHLHRIGNGVLSDLAGIYMLGVSTGTRIHHNKIHDITRFERGYGGWGIYFDAGSSEITVEKNVVYRTYDGGLHLHNYDYPYGDTITNNVFGAAKYGSMIRNAAHNTKIHPYHARLTKNIIFNDSASLLAGNYWNADQKVQLDGNCYWSFGVDLIQFPGSPQVNGGQTGEKQEREAKDIASGNRVQLEDWRRRSGQDAGSIAEDPKFLNRAADDYRLANDSPARSIGIESIDDIDQAGLYGDEKWTRQSEEVTPRVNEFCTVNSKQKEYLEDFEEYDLGDHPDGIDCFDGTREDGGKTEAGISVSSEQAANGKQALKVVDAAGLHWVHDPNLALSQTFANGAIRESFSLYIDQPSVNIQKEWRQYDGGGYKTGPTFNIKSDPKQPETAVVSASGRVLTRIPQKTWVRITLQTVNGPISNAAAQTGNAAGTETEAGTESSTESAAKAETAKPALPARLWTITLEVPGQELQTFDGFNALSPEYNSVNWMGFISLSNEPSVFYIDDWSVNVKP